MTAPVLIGIGLAGGVGALARFLIGAAVTARTHTRFPFGTLTVNLSGSFVLGILAGAALHGGTYRVAAAGLIGAYTTFSTWMSDSRRLADQGEWHLGALNVVVSLALGLAAIWLGRELGTLF